MVRYRTCLVLTYYLKKLVAEPPREVGGPFHPRVSLDDYLANLHRFRAEARARGIPIVFLTRPHQAPPDVLKHTGNWRSRVPDYNAALVSWAKDQGVPFIDVQGEFAGRPPTLFSDECHFFPDGYQILAELVYRRLLPDGLQRRVEPPDVPAASETATAPVGRKRS
jgi:lysophospholipase L1-like esterase